MQVLELALILVLGRKPESGYVLELVRQQLESELRLALEVEVELKLEPELKLVRKMVPV